MKTIKMKILLIITLLIGGSAYAEPIEKIDCSKLTPEELRGIDQGDCKKIKSSIRPEKVSQIDAFHFKTKFSSFTCELEAKLALSSAGTSSYSDAVRSIDACLSKEKIEVKPLFIKAMAEASKKPSAARLLKEYYATWMTGFNAISPRVDDRVIDYKKRQDDELTKANAAWDKFEIEFSM